MATNRGLFLELIPGAKYYPQMEKSAKAASLKGWYREITSKFSKVELFFPWSLLAFVLKVLKTPGPANYIMPNYLFNGPQHTLTPRNVPIEGGKSS